MILKKKMKNYRIKELYNKKLLYKCKLVHYEIGLNFERINMNNKLRKI